MNLLNDIKKFLKDDDEHVLKIEIAWDGVTVYLDYDPELEFREESIIPIHFTTVEEFCYIPHDKYIEMFKPCDFGMHTSEVKLVAKIMEYLDNHKEDIKKLCKGLLVDEREVYKKKHDENSNVAIG